MAYVVYVKIIGSQRWDVFLRPSVYILNAVRCPYVRNGARGQLSRRWRHNENDVIRRTEAASAVGVRRHNGNDVIMTIAGLWRYGDWRHVATGCNALVDNNKQADSWLDIYKLRLSSPVSSVGWFGFTDAIKFKSSANRSQSADHTSAIIVQLSYPFLHCVHEKAPPPSMFKNLQN